MRRFVLQACDPETGCPVLEARLLVDDLTVLRALLGSRTDVDPDLAMGYPLDGQDIAAFAARFDLPSDWGGRDVLLVPWQRLRELPYLVHTNFELALMLEGRKPLAVFHDALGSEWLEEIVRCFEPFVAQERFTKRVVNQATCRSRG